MDYNPFLPTTGLCIFEQNFSRRKSPELSFCVADRRIGIFILE